MNIIVINFKKYLFTFLSVFFIIFLLIFSENNFLATSNGLSIFLNNIFPSLFPFLVATELLYNSNFIHVAQKYTKKIIPKLFNVPSCSSIAIILGLISGYPIGAKIITNLKKDNLITIAEAERLLSFTNNSSPMFIITSIGFSIFGNKKLGIMLLSIHILSAIIVGIIFRFWKYNDKNVIDYSCISLKESTSLKIQPSTIDIFINSIKNSVQTILHIGGFIIIFSVILSILKSTGILNVIAYLLSLTGIPETYSTTLIYGLFEISNGINLLKNIYQPNILCLIIVNCILGFGGISILFQIYSIISKYRISIKPYLYGKILQSIISIILTCIIF